MMCQSELEQVYVREGTLWLILSFVKYWPPNYMEGLEEFRQCLGLNRSLRGIAEKRLLKSYLDVN